MSQNGLYCLASADAGTLVDFLNCQNAVVENVFAGLAVDNAIFGLVKSVLVDGLLFAPNLNS